VDKLVKEQQEMTNRNLPAGSWVTVPDQFRPAQIVFSQQSNTHYVILESLNANAAGKREIVKMRAPSFEGLRQDIARRFPQATFSVLNENAIPRTENGIALDTRTLELKAEWDAEKTAYLESTAVDHANRQKLDGMSQEQKQELTKQSIVQMMQGNVWLSNNPTFFTWGPNQENYQTLLAYFAAMKWELPTVDQCAHAFRWLWDANYFHKQETYRRSEEHLHPRQFDASMLQPTTVTITPEQLAAAKKKLLIFNGRRITNEMALTQISQAEIDAINQEAGSAHARSTDDLTAEVKANRSVRSRAQLASDSQYF
jgi:hypothetical protein